MNICLFAITLFSTALCLTGKAPQSEEERIGDFFETHLSTLSSQYQKAYGNEWLPSKVKKVLSFTDTEREESARLVVFDKGYLAYDDNDAVLCQNCEGVPFGYPDNITFQFGKIGCWLDGTFYNDRGLAYPIDEFVGTGAFASDLYHPIADTANFNNFQMDSAVAKLPNVRDRFDASKWGNYSPICIQQNELTDCGACASVNLLYTYKLSNRFDLTKGETPTTLRKTMQTLEKWKNNMFGDGILPTDFLPGFNSFIKDSGYTLASTRYLMNVQFPSLGCFFSGNVANTGHYAVIVGSGHSTAWWFFKTYWVIVTTWNRNYDVDLNGYPTAWWNNYDGCFYVVDQQYLHFHYAIFDAQGKHV